jgi:hypothetical protein
MRNSVVLNLAGAAAFAIMACSAISTPAAAFGLSDRQADEVGDFVRCKTYLLKGDLRSFEQDPDCGKGPVVYSLNSLGTVSGSSSKKKKRHDYCYEWPSEGLFSLTSEGGGYCPTY